MDTKILDKIKKLLALAGNNDQSAEADAAAKKAAKLAAEHGLKISDVNTDDEKPGSGVEVNHVDQMGLSTFKWELPLSQGIANAFECRMILSIGHKRGSGALKFIGFPEDVELCIWYHKFLRRSILRHGEMKYHAAKDRTDYCFGMALTIIKRLQESYRKVKEEVTGTEIVIYKESQINDFVDNTFSGLRQIRRNSKVKDREAFFHGRKDGETVQLHKSVA